MRGEKKLSPSYPNMWMMMRRSKVGWNIKLQLSSVCHLAHRVCDKLGNQKIVNRKKQFDFYIFFSSLITHQISKFLSNYWGEIKSEQDTLHDLRTY